MTPSPYWARSTQAPTSLEGKVALRPVEEVYGGVSFLWRLQLDLQQRRACPGNYNWGDSLLPGPCPLASVGTR